MNNKVWAFGDSMTAPIDGEGPYRDWLGRNVKVYCDFISEHLSMESINKAKAGNSPNQIFDDFLMNYKEINSGDIVILGWSPIMRCRIAAKNYANITKPLWRQVWASGWSGGVEQACVDGTYITTEVAEQLIVNRYEFSDFYSQEINRWIDFVKDWAKLKNVKIINWSWCEEEFGGKHSINLEIPIRRRTDMDVETGGIVKDGHYGEVGHKELADEIIEYLNK
jgi:hypothetical protein